MKVNHKLTRTFMNTVKDELDFTVRQHLAVCDDGVQKAMRSYNNANTTIQELHTQIGGIIDNAHVNACIELGERWGLAKLTQRHEA